MVDLKLYVFLWYWALFIKAIFTSYMWVSHFVKHMLCLVHLERTLTDLHVSDERVCVCDACFLWDGNIPVQLEDLQAISLTKLNEMDMNFPRLHHPIILCII